MKKRWERIGQQAPLITLDYLTKVAIESREDYAKLKSPPARWDVEDVMLDRVHDCACMLVQWHIENPEPLDGYDGPRDIARLVCHHVIEYLFGDWRNGYVNVCGEKRSVEQCRHECPWFSEYRLGLASAFLIEDESLIRQIVEWPGKDLEFEDDTLYMNETWQQDDIAYHLALATFLRGQIWKNPFSSTKRSTAGTRGKPVLLASAVDALLDEQVVEFHKLITRYLKWFLSNEFLKKQFDDLVSFEASILCGLAGQRGMPPLELPIELEDLILTPSTTFAS